MRKQKKIERINYHEVPKAILPIDLDIFEKGGETPYLGEYLTSRHDDKTILYKVHLGLFSDNIFIKGYLAEKKELEHEIKRGNIIPIKVGSGNIAGIIESVLVDLNLLFKDSLGRIWASEDATGEIKVNLETGIKKYQYDCFKDEGTYHITQGNVMVK